jgi:hypothetical protein
MIGEAVGHGKLGLVDQQLLEDSLVRLAAMCVLVSWPLATSMLMSHTSRSRNLYRHCMSQPCCGRSEIWSSC